MKKTIKRYDINAYETKFEANVLACTPARENSCFEVVLDQTAFFPEEGGQSPDQGMLADAKVLDVQIREDVIYHYVDKPLKVGEEVIGEIDWAHRFNNMQQHSAEHIFSGLTYKTYGYQNVGFHLSNQIVTMDFDGPLTPEQVEELETKVNEAIANNVEIKTGYPTKEELEKLEYRSKKEIEGELRIVEVVGYDVCACCAPHVKRTGEIGGFKVMNVQNYKGGVRISFLCGFRMLQAFRDKSKILSDLVGVLTTSEENVVEMVTKQKTQIQSLKTKLGSAKQELVLQKLEQIPGEQEDVIIFEEDIDTPVMRNVVNSLTETHMGYVGIFVGNDDEGYSFIVGSKEKDCRDLSNILREKLEARGGGSNLMIQGSVSRTKEMIEEFFSSL